MSTNANNYFCMIKLLKVERCCFHIENIVDVSKIHVEKQYLAYFCMIKLLKVERGCFHIENIVDVSKIHGEKQYLAYDIWTTLSALACFGESTTPSQYTSLRMDSASIQKKVKSFLNKIVLAFLNRSQETLARASES